VGFAQRGSTAFCERYSLLNIVTQDAVSTCLKTTLTRVEIPNNYGSRDMHVDFNIHVYFVYWAHGLSRD
jgi:hypothetical protein